MQAPNRAKGPSLLEYRDIYAGGRLVCSGSPDVITIVNPATEEVVGAVPAAVGTDVDKAVRSARRAFDDGAWATCAPAQRADALDRLAAALEARAEEAARLVTAEMGMPIGSSRQHNAASPCAILRYYANLARAMDTEETRTAVSFAGRTVVRREPAGVAAVITSWNYPIMLAFSQLAPALAAGCTIVLKPAAATSLSAFILAEAFEAADFPPGVFNLVTGTHQTAGALARHPGVDIVSFSGPTKQGRWIASICGAELKPAAIELGGQSTAIVLDDADLEQTGAALGRLIFGNSGQTCFAMSRVLVPEQRYDDLVDALTEQAGQLRVGDPLSEATTMGPLASSRRRADVEARVRSGVADGARVVAGARRPASPVRGYFYEPTVLTDVTPGMAIAREEICGPVATLIRYSGPGGGGRVRQRRVRARRHRVDRRPAARPGHRQADAGRHLRHQPVRAGPRLAVGRPRLSGTGSAYGPEGMDPVPDLEVGLPADVRAV